MLQRVRIPHRGYKLSGFNSPQLVPFVCHSTPHFDSTSREVSYSVRSYHTPCFYKCKYFFIEYSKEKVLDIPVGVC